MLELSQELGVYGCNQKEAMRVKSSEKRAEEAEAKGLLAAVLEFVKLSNRYLAGQYAVGRRIQRYADHLLEALDANDLDEVRRVIGMLKEDGVEWEELGREAHREVKDMFTAFQAKKK
jgi:hypothetical protein